MTQVPQMQPAAPKQGNGLAVAGMILGIIALALFCIWWLSIPSAIVGLILSILGSKKARETGVGAGMAKAGTIMSIIAIGLAILIVILAVVGISLMGNKLQEMQREVEQHKQQTMLLIESFLC
jgi:uncharacterized membrane protein